VPPGANGEALRLPAENRERPLCGPNRSSSMFYFTARVNSLLGRERSSRVGSLLARASYVLARQTGPGAALTGPMADENLASLSAR
jgi:hypothetical protein